MGSHNFSNSWDERSRTSSSRNYRESRCCLYYGERDYANHPIPWLVFVCEGIYCKEDVSSSVQWQLRGVEKFVDGALKHLKKIQRPPRNRRAKYLIALHMSIRGVVEEISFQE